MREIHSHKVNPANDKLEITVRDKPGAGGASHCYKICGYAADRNPSLDQFDDQHHTATFILFQNGPINEAGVNGITQEALIAICIDRLECFQNGPYACRENAEALEALQLAQYHLHKRTKARLAKGIEGTHVVDVPENLAVIEAKLKQIVVEQLGVDEDQIRPESNFIEDLGADSLDQIELIMAIEEDFRVELTDDEVEKIVTFADAVKAISDRK